jgi:zinc protease
MKINNYILLTTFVLLQGIIVTGQSGKIALTEFDLKNGLHVILHQNNSVPIVAINVTYHVGSKNEKANLTGFAHFFEHLMFEGSPNIERGQYFKYVQNAGGEENASTSFDITNYYEILPSNQLALGLWLESERMLHLKIDSIGIETQRKVVKEERKQTYENQPYGRLESEIFAASYKVMPYKWLAIGEDQYIDQANYNEFMAFYQEFYVPQNAVLVIAGDIQIESAKDLVKRYFEDIPIGKNNIYRPSEKEPLQIQEIRKTTYDKVELPAIIYAYHIPAIGAPDYYEMKMLQKYLTGGESSKFAKSLVDKQQIAMTVEAYPFSLENDGLFLILGLTNIGKTAEDLDKAMDTEIIKAKTEEISDNDFQKIKNQVENDFYSKNATMKGIADNLAGNYTFFKDANLINTEIEKYQKITKADLVRVAKQYLKPENRVVLYYLPESLKNKEAKQ